MASSRLLEYEGWNRVRVYGLIGSHTNSANSLLMGIRLMEMNRRVLARALEPLPVLLHTLDRPHLHTIESCVRVARRLRSRATTAA